MAEATAPASAAARAEKEPTAWMGGWKVCIFGSLAIIAQFWALRLYQGVWAWNAGLDSRTADFDLYWHNLFYAELVLVTIGTLVWWGLLVRRGEKVVTKEVTADEEVRRIVVFWGLVGITSIVLYFMASYFPNGDGAWHQTAIRDTALTPSHIVMFFWAFPLGITFSVATYLYGRYWVPKVYGAEKGFPWPFFFLIAAAVTEMFQVAMNEFGHSVWQAEEFFADPFHWPFVTYGWLASGIFALWAGTLLRLYAIEDEIIEEPEPVPAEA